MEPHNPAFSWQRQWGMFLRHFYVLRGSWPRLLELAYWPTMQMVLWGFITTFFLQHSSWVAQAAGVLISAVLLWDVFFRSSLGVSIPFMDEMWARNLGQIFISPLRVYEFVASLLLMSFMRTLIGVTPAALLALPFYDVWVFQIGLPLIAFFVNLLVMGWTIGLLVSAMIMRFGLGAESLAWFGIFLFSPVSGIYYPIDTLPGWLQPVAWSLPSSHVFEGMRAVLFESRFDMGHFTSSVSLNALYLTVAVLFFLRMYRVAREKGLLLQQGE